VTLLSVENLRVSYDNIKALHGLNFQIAEGEIVCIIGANGAGKSTTLRAISRMVKTESGTRMTLQGRDLLGYSADRVVSELGISHVPEGRRLFDNLTVTENLKLATFARRDEDRIAVDLKRMLNLFPRLEERQNQKAGTMSGGEQQMLAVARGLMAQPEILFIDELSLGLSPILSLSLFESLGSLKEEGLTMLLVEQNVAMSLAVSDYAYVLAEGKVHLEGPARELMKNDEIRRTYLGI
jgi:branched-chain amino acid transport system ATP-binding protein